MVRVGVAGGIGSGKTTFCKVWQELGAFVVFADDFAKQLMVTDPELIQAIRHTFGKSSYLEDGTLNRKFLADEAFSKGRVEELNNIVHPILWKRIDELSDQKEREGIQVFVKEAALLLDHGRPKNLDVVILLEADSPNRIERVVNRDNTSEELVFDRISKQKTIDEVREFADHIVTNNGSIAELKEKARILFTNTKKKL